MSKLAKLKDIFTLFSLSNEQKKGILCAATTLFAVCASAALVLSGINELVFGVIEDNTRAPVRAAMERVLPAEEYREVEFEFEEAHGVAAVYEAEGADGLSGYCVEAKAQNYDEKMTVVVAVNAEGKVIAVEVVSIPEGADTRVRDKSFLSQFAGKGGKLTAVLSAPKGDTQISAITGAEEISKAVTECVNHAVEAVSQLEAEKAKEAAGE